MYRFPVALILVFLNTGVLSVGQTPRSDVPSGWFGVPLDQLKWTKATDGSGRESATVFGDRSKHELFGYVVRSPPNVTSTAHTHPANRFVVVLSGTFYVGHGNQFDASQLERRSAGTFFSEPAGVAHFGATKGEGTVLYIVGIGPDRTDPVEK